MAIKKICFIISGLNAGGLENYLLRFLKFLPDTQGITVIVRNGKKGDLYEEYVKTNVDIRFQSIGYINLKKLRSLHRFFKKEKFETVCDFGGNFAGTSLLAARMAGVPKRIAFFRRSSNAFKESKLNLIYAGFVNKLVYKYATKILSNSQYAIDFYFKYRSADDSRFAVIPNGVNASAFTTQLSVTEAREACGIPQGKFVVGHVGRYDWAKNHETIFEVIKMITKKYDDVIFVFCGKDTDSDAFKKRLSLHEINGEVITLGLRNDLDVVLKSFDVFYFPSVTEGQPNALIEAIMAGLPVISSDILPIKEVLPEWAHKNMVNPIDVEAAAGYISDLKSGKMNREELIYKDEVIRKFDLKQNLMLFQNEL